MRLDFSDTRYGYPEAPFTDVSGRQCRIAASRKSEHFCIGGPEGSITLTRGMAYALHSAIETWLDTGELPKYVECTDDPPRCGVR